MRTYPLLIFASLLFSGCSQRSGEPGKESSLREDTVNADGKKGMILLSDRPPNLETPLRYFKDDYTPNDVFFVRWHLSVLPSSVDENEFRLRVTGH
ncbi:MAG: hypothetical protein ABI855_06315, partial [Bacteroidota bacterium]